MLAPGRYTRSAFRPRVTFEVGTGWTAEQVAAGFFDIEDAPGSLDVVAIQFANVSGPATAAAAAAQIEERGNLSVSDPEAIEVDGLSAVRLIVETTDPLDAQPPIFRTVLSVPAGPLSIASARRLEITLVDAEDRVLAIMLGGSIADWDHAMQLARPVMESIRIGD